MGDPYSALLDDLVAEQVSLRMLVGGAGDSAWDLPTPAAGWAVRDQLHHLARSDEVAAGAISDPEVFVALRDRILADHDGDDTAQRRQARSSTAADVLRRWDRAHWDLQAALRTLDGGARISWFGPPLSARSFATARLMEIWAHGEDVAAALGVVRAPTDRLRHVAHLGVATRHWSYHNRGLAPPPVDVFVELSGPDGLRWSWGPPDAPERITGPAADFCRVVTQRTHPDTTTLTIAGPSAAEWMRLAQCFAGPPTTGPDATGRRATEHAGGHR